MVPASPLRVVDFDGNLELKLHANETGMSRIIPLKSIAEKNRVVRSSVHIAHPKLHDVDSDVLCRIAVEVVAKLQVNVLV